MVRRPRRRAFAVVLSAGPTQTVVNRESPYILLHYAHTAVDDHGVYFSADANAVRSPANRQL